VNLTTLSLGELLQGLDEPERSSENDGPGSAFEVWSGLIKNLLQNGSLRSPRGQETLEMNTPFVSRVDATRPVLRDPVRRLGYRFMCAEAAWILSGDNRLETIAPYSKEIARYSDDGSHFFGAYGPRYLAQRQYVIDKLKQDPETRQAIINVWQENPPDTKDVPCTLSWQFLLRDDKLNLVATMRSSDVWLGWPYDIFNQAMLLGAMCLDLREQKVGEFHPGEISLVAGSQHLYARNAMRAFIVARQERSKSPETEPWVFSPLEFNSREHLIEHLWKVARKDTLAVSLNRTFLSELKWSLDNGLEVS